MATRVPEFLNSRVLESESESEFFLAISEFAEFPNC